LCSSTTVQTANCSEYNTLMLHLRAARLDLMRCRWALILGCGRSKMPSLGTEFLIAFFGTFVKEHLCTQKPCNAPKARCFHCRRSGWRVWMSGAKSDS
jgi:hypothetical protein